MKVTGREATAFCARPPAGVVGVLLHGPDAGLVSARRQSLVLSVEGGELVRLDAAEVRRGPGTVETALKSQGFFTGRPIVLIQGGTDGLARPLAPILEDLSGDDGLLIVTADVLAGRSPLRKLFETARNLAAIGCYPEKMTARELGDALAERRTTAGLAPDAETALLQLEDDMDRGSFLRFLDLVALSALDRSEPIGAGDIAALAPAGLEGDIDRFVAAVAEGEPGKLGPLLRRLSAGGSNAVGIVIALQRHFRMLLTAQSSENGIGAIRPPLMGPRRDRIMRQLRLWSAARLEQANHLLFETDMQLRSSSPLPDIALLERTALRLAIMASR